MIYKKEYLNLFSSNNHEQTYRPRCLNFNSTYERLKGAAVTNFDLTYCSKWDETFRFEIGKPAVVLTIDLFDHDVSLFGKHDFLGQVEVQFANLAIEAVSQEWMELQSHEGKLEIVAGSLHVYI